MPHARQIALVLACVITAGLATAVPLGARAAGTDTYTLDPVHTRVMFAISHAGFSQAIGTVSGSTGTLVFDRDDWRGARLEVRVPMTRLDLGDAKWNAAALATNLLDGARHPDAHFVSDTVEPGDANHARVCGQLTLRGVARPLCMEVVLNALKRHPLPPFRRTAGFSATATLSRADYGIDAWKSVIGDRVELRIEAEAVRGNRPASADDVEPVPAVPMPDEAAASTPVAESDDTEAAEPVAPAAPEPVPVPVPVP